MRWIIRILTQHRAIASTIVAATALTNLARSFGESRVVFVNHTAQGANNGSIWVDAFQDLQNALAIAQSGDEIWVAAGVYQPDRGTGDRLATFRLVSGVGVYGGFAGCESSREQRDWVTNETTLAGDLAGNDGPANCEDVSDCCREHDGVGCDDALCEQIVCRETSYQDCCDTLPFQSWDSQCVARARRACCHLGNWHACENSHVVVTARDCGSDTVLDGFTISGSYFDFLEGRDDYPGYLSGAGALSANSAVAIANCKFERNYGAGIRGDASSITLEDTSFYDHRPGVSAGFDASDVTAVGCSFFDHARIFNVQGSATLRRCTFIGQTNAFVRGDATVDSCRFMHGNGLNLWDGRWSIGNSYFLGNAQHLKLTSGSGIIDNSVFIDGSAVTASVGVGLASGLFRNCTFLNNDNSAIRAGWANLYVLNCTLLGNGWGLNVSNTLGGGIDLDNSSAEVLNSIIWGNNGGSPLQTREEQQIALHWDSTLEIDYSIVEGWSGVFGEPHSTGNFGDDPLFVDPNGADDISGTADDDVRLLPNSPAINAGLSTSLYNLPTDLDGHARILCGDVDIGAYEFGIGDSDCNRTVNLSDFAWFPLCLTGPPGPQSGPFDTGCESFDLNADSAIDLIDMAGFQRVFPGP